MIHVYDTNALWRHDEILRIRHLEAEIADMQKEIDRQKQKAVMAQDATTHTPEVKNVEMFVELTTGLAELFPGRAWYRGQSNSSWNLRPAIARIEHQAGYEPDLSVTFMTRARTRHRDCPAPNDLPGWLFLMQHYGLYTRLLDWTELPLVALFFAVTGSEAADAAVFILNPRLLNAGHGHTAAIMLPHHPHAKKLISSAFQTTDSTSEVVAILPPEIDYRMLLQRGGFTVHGDRSPLDSHPLHDQFLGKLTILQERRASIRNQLHALGINRSYLFPDLSNLAQSLNEGTGSAS